MTDRLENRTQSWPHLIPDIIIPLQFEWHRELIKTSPYLLRTSLDDLVLDAPGTLA